MSYRLATYIAELVSEKSDAKIERLKQQPLGRIDDENTRSQNSQASISLPVSTDDDCSGKAGE